MPSLDNAEDTFDAAMSLLKVLAAFSFLLCLFTLTSLLVVKDRKELSQNKLMLLLYSLIFSEMCYCACIIPWCGARGVGDPHEDYAVCRSRKVAFALFFGSLTSSISAFVGFTVAYTMLRRKKFPMNMFYSVCVITLMCAAFAITANTYGRVKEKDIDEGYYGRSHEYTFDTILDVYNAFQIAIMVISFCFATVTFYVLYSINAISAGTVARTNAASISSSRKINVKSEVSNRTTAASNASSSVGTNKTNSKQVYPMFVLASRLGWYPVILVISRLGITFYQLYFQTTFATYVADVQAISNPGLMTAGLWVSLTLLPLGGAGCCLLFVYLQPGAWENLKKTALNIVKYVTCGVFGASCSDSGSDGDSDRDREAGKGANVNDGGENNKDKNRDSHMSHSSGGETASTDTDLELSHRPGDYMDRDTSIDSHSHYGDMDYSYQDTDSSFEGSRNHASTGGTESTGTDRERAYTYTTRVSMHYDPSGDMSLEEYRDTVHRQILQEREDGNHDSMLHALAKDAELSHEVVEELEDEELFMLMDIQNAEDERSQYNDNAASAAGTTTTTVTVGAAGAGASTTSSRLESSTVVNPVL